MDSFGDQTPHIAKNWADLKNKMAFNLKLVIALIGWYCTQVQTLEKNRSVSTATRVKCHWNTKTTNNDLSSTLNRKTKQKTRTSYFSFGNLGIDVTHKLLSHKKISPQFLSPFNSLSCFCLTVFEPNATQPSMNS